jgi:hypothetical protein
MNEFENDISPETRSKLDAYLIKYLNHKGFRQSFQVDREAKRITRLIEFQWGRKFCWTLLKLPTFKYRRTWEL